MQKKKGGTKRISKAADTIPTIVPQFQPIKPSRRKFSTHISIYKKIP